MSSVILNDSLDYLAGLVSCCAPLLCLNVITTVIVTTVIITIIIICIMYIYIHIYTYIYIYIYIHYFSFLRRPGQLRRASPGLAALRRGGGVPPAELIC